MPKPIGSGVVVTAAFLNDLSGIVDRSTSTVDVTSTTTLTSVYSKSIAAASMSTDRSIHGVIIGDLLNATGSNRGWQMKILFGATTLYDATNASIMVNNAQRVPFILEFWMGNKASASVQEFEGTFKFSKNDETAPTTGIGPMTTLAWQGWPIGGTAAENSALAKTFDVQFAPSFSSASLSIRKKYAFLELL